MKTESKPLYFRVCFASMTDRAREFWAEGKYKFAYEFLADGFGLNREQATLVLSGKMKLAQDPEGKEGVDGVLVEDNWTFNEDYSFYPDPGDPILAVENHQLHQENKEPREELEADQKRRDDYGSRYSTVVKDLFDYEEETPEQRVQRMNLQFALEKQGESYHKHLLEADTKPTPKPYTTYKMGNGWVLPNGKFYPLEDAMQHIWCAERLGKTEAQAEKLGWVKLSQGLTGLNIISHKMPTQKQIDTVFAWAKNHANREDKAKAWLENSYE